MFLERNSCVICDKPLELKKNIKNIPLHMGVKNNIYVEDIFLDQMWGQCIRCGCLQLMKVIDPLILYSINHDPGSQGSLWAEHHTTFAQFILEDNPKSIVEIGGSNGRLADIILGNKNNINYTIIDPCADTLNNKVSVYNLLFEEYNKDFLQSDSVVHSHTLEHVLDPKKFLSKIYNAMHYNTSMYISFPDMYEMLLSGSTSALCFEHSYYIDINQIKYLLEEIGFEINKQFNFKNHSYFLKITKKKNIVRNNKNLKINFEQLNYLTDVWNEAQFFVEKTLNKLNNIPTYIFGAHIFSQSLISLGLTHDSIVGILDDSVAKQGKQLYGYNLTVYSPQIISSLKNVNVVLRAGKYQEQIKNNLFNINSNVVIFE